MKKTILFFTLLFAAFTGKAQEITLEHSFNESMSSWSFVTDMGGGLNFSENVKKYILYDKNAGQIKICNLDYSLYKSIRIDDANSRSIILMNASVKLFNDDDLIEFVVRIQYGGAGLYIFYQII